MNDEMLVLPATADNPDAQTVELSMQITSVTRKADGQRFDFKFARFLRGDGVEVLFPWEQLREIVLEWIEVEKAEANE